MDDDVLAMIEARCRAASTGPWRAVVEGRDQTSGDDFIQVGDDDTEPDMYVWRSVAGSTVPASPADLDFIAAARQDVPALLAEIRRLRDAAR